MNNEQIASVPEGYMLVERNIWTEQQVEAATACITRLKVVPGMSDRDLAMAAIDAAQCKAPDVTLADLQPSAQHHGETVAWFTDDHLTDKSATTWDRDTAEHWRTKGWPVSKLYTHADSGEVERLSAELEVIKKLYAESCQASYDFGALRAQLSEAQALLKALAQPEYGLMPDVVAKIQRYALPASVEPSAPVERDERADYEAACHARAKANRRVYEPYYFRRTSADDRYLNPMAESGWQAWQARAALERKP